MTIKLKIQKVRPKHLRGTGGDFGGEGNRGGTGAELGETE